MTKATSPAEKKPEWDKFQLNFELSATLKKQVLAVIKTKVEEAMQMLNLPEAGLTIVSSKNLSVDIFVSQTTAKSFIPSSIKVGDYFPLTPEKNRKKKAASTGKQLAGANNKAVEAHAADSGEESHSESITYRGAVKDPPPTPDPLKP